MGEGIPTTKMPQRDSITPLNFLRAVIGVLAISLTLFTIYYAHSRMMVRVRFSIIFVGAGICLFYLTEILDIHTEDTQDVAESSSRFGSIQEKVPDAIKRNMDLITTVYLLTGAVLAVLGTLYLNANFDRLFEDAAIIGYESNDYLAGGILILIVIDATRRAFGNMIAGVAVVSVLYAHRSVGPAMPGLLWHSGYTWEQIIREGSVSLAGIYHTTIVGIGTTWVAIFIMFAGIAKSYGLMDWVLDVGRELGTSLRTGVVQIALISSMIMGSITGSAAANTATTGSFTIPMMKDQGIRSDYAAAIESVASSGGQILPPIMGVAAFLMADILGVQYVQIVQSGTIPALLFYCSVGIALHLVVLKHGWTTTTTTEFDKSVLTKGLKFAIPIGVLVYTLLVMQLTPLAAGLYTIISMVIVSFVAAAIMDRSIGGIVKAVYQTFRGLKEGAIEMAPLVGVLGAMGLIVDMIVTTGLSQKVSTALVGMGAGALLVVLIFAMISSILFGLGMPTPAAYILVVILVAPGLIELDVPNITAHMFVFYFAMLSAITPPVAIAVAVGSRISNASFTKSCVQAMRIGAPGFVIPYTFIYNNSLIYWSFPETILAFAAVLSGTIALVVTTVGHNGSRSLPYVHRGLYLLLGFGAFFGGTLSVMVQLGSALAILLLLLVGNGRVSLPLADLAE